MGGYISKYFNLNYPPALLAALCANCELMTRFVNTNLSTEMLLWGVCVNYPDSRDLAYKRTF